MLAKSLAAMPRKAISGFHVLVGGGALAGFAGGAFDHRDHALGRSFLAVAGAGGAGDAFVHQGAAQVVAAGV